eukprot:scaffold5653_cov147-Cylindrotheca_fusiformis.AAC.24
MGIVSYVTPIMCMCSSFIHAMTVASVLRESLFVVEFRRSFQVLAVLALQPGQDLLVHGRKVAKDVQNWKA